MLYQDRATYCIKIIPNQEHPYFLYIDSLSEKEALKIALDNDKLTSECFVQVGIFITNHILHSSAKETYIFTHRKQGV